MREHMGLYRGKQRESGAWVEGSFLKCGEAHRPIDRPDMQFSDCYIVPKTDLDIVRLVGTNTIGLDIWAYHVDPDTVGECTGLRDKNGKLIFEGDILQREGCGKSGVVHTAKYHEIYGMWYVGSRLRGQESMSLLAPTSDFYEIIGNIHDNPELLKGGEGEW